MQPRDKNPVVSLKISNTKWVWTDSKLLNIFAGNQLPANQKGFGIQLLSWPTQSACFFLVSSKRTLILKPMLAKLCVNPFDWSVPVLSGEGSQLPLCFGANGRSIMQENTSSHQPHSQHILPRKSTLFGGEKKACVFFPAVVFVIFQSKWLNALT